MAKKKEEEKKQYSDNPLFATIGLVEEPPKTEVVIVPVDEQTKKNLLFDMVNSIFVDRCAYRNYTKEAIKQNAFMINRIMSIQYPTEARMLDRQYTSPYAMYFLWNSMLWNGKRKEPWVFTKGSRKEKETVNDDKVFSEKEIQDYCNYYDIERVLFDDAFRFFREDTIKSVKEYLNRDKE